METIAWMYFCRKGNAVKWFYKGACTTFKLHWCIWRDFIYRVTDFRSFVCSLFPKTIILLFILPPVWKGVYSKRKEFASNTKASKLLPFRVDLFSEGRQTNVERDTALSVLSFSHDQIKENSVDLISYVNHNTNLTHLCPAPDKGDKGK